MKKFDRLFGVVIGIAVLAGLLNMEVTRVSAEIGNGWNGAQRVTVGETATVRSVTIVSSATGTALWAASLVRPDGILFNNSAFTLWIGTDSLAYVVGYQHPNITNGFPVLASSTFRLGGSYQGALYGTSDVGVGAINVRILDGQVGATP